MSKPFVVYQALGAACKKHSFTAEEKAELHKRVLKDMPHNKVKDRNGKYRAVMGYAKQLKKELDERINGIEIQRSPDSKMICKQVNRTADEVRQEKTKHSLLKAGLSVAAIMDEL